ncbi:RipA family octameric membrane protein [Aeoliella sp. SH292]|uniref:RipA family octameric membrane protein n=1 Tax=Aeoliella sp. SH292 TaxID=3454464 RepID=UPI003F9D2AB7
MQLLKYFYTPNPNSLITLSKEDYVASLQKDEKKAEKAYAQAWDSRKFEIELYWKRATYFWALIATTFAGYFALVNSANYKTEDPYHHAEVYFVICIGFVMSCAFLCINIGSKSWQRHWETHVDLLEDLVVGPLYKTVNQEKTFSVSKINEIVSAMLVMVWVLIAAKYLVDQDLINWNPCGMNLFVVIASLGAFGFLFAMLYGHGRGRFGDRSVRMYRRTFRFETATPSKK